MNRIIKGAAMAAILVFFASCKPMDTLSEHSFGLQVIALNTVNDEQLINVVGVVCDGASSVELRLEYKSTLVPSAILIDADAKFGTFTSGPPHYDRSSIRYTAPAVFPGGEGQSVVNFPITIQVSVGNQKVYYNTELKLVRTPILMAHDMASDASAFKSLQGELVSGGNYSDLGLHAVDYSASSMSSYQTNSGVIAKGIDSLRKQCLKSGYVANKVDVVGHGTGGVLSRIYMQSTGYRYDISKLITIDSPHYGTQLADFGIELGKANPNTILSLIGNLGVMTDMQVGSVATKNLNDSRFNKIKVPTHTISSTYTGGNHVLELINHKQYLGAIISYLVNELNDQAIFGQSNDVFVPLSSQNSGLDAQYTTNYDGQWHYSILKLVGLGSKITTLLASNTNSATSPLTLDGFKFSTLSYTSPGAKVEPFVEPTPVTSCNRNQNVTVEFHTPQSVSSSIFVVTQSNADGVDKILYMDNLTTNGTTYNWNVPADAPANLKFHLLALSNNNATNTTYYSTSYNVQVAQ